MIYTPEDKSIGVPLNESGAEEGFVFQIDTVTKKARRHLVDSDESLQIRLHLKNANGVEYAIAVLPGQCSSQVCMLHQDRILLQEIAWEEVDCAGWTVMNRDGTVREAL